MFRSWMVMLMSVLAIASAGGAFAEGGKVDRSATSLIAGQTFAAAQARSIRSASSSGELSQILIAARSNQIRQSTSGTALVTVLMASDTSEAAPGDASSPEPGNSEPPANDGVCSIQVGAHSSLDNARRQLRRVESQNKDLLKKAKGVIVPLVINGNPFYRVRFGPFTCKEADSVCDEIQKRGMSCLVMPGGNWDVGSSLDVDSSVPANPAVR